MDFVPGFPENGVGGILSDMTFAEDRLCRTLALDFPAVSSGVSLLETGER